MSEPIGVAVIGAGYWGSKLVHEYQRSELAKRKLRLLRVCDASLPTLLSCKMKFSLSDDLLTRNPVDVFNDPNVSAVHIATPNRTHYPLAKRALESGKNVLIEKPMTLHSREAYDLVNLATSHELVLRVGHIFRHNAALQAARRILKLRAVGRVYYARVQWTDHLPPFHDRDIVFDLGPHPIDILNLLLGSWPMQASVVGRAYRNTGEEHEVAYVIAEFQDDILAHIELSWLHPGRRR
jgi:predicted dehydrogenase